MFSKAKHIWQTGKQETDYYADFLDEFFVEKILPAKLYISIDSDYTVYINGKLAGFGQYPDFPYAKVYDVIDIEEFLVKGKNRLAIAGYYAGAEFMTYYKGKAALIYQIMQGESVLAYSSHNTKCRKSLDYQSGAAEKITNQLGFNYHYDVSKYDGWQNAGYDFSAWQNSLLVKEAAVPVYLCPIKKSELLANAESTLIKTGSYEFGGGNSTAEKQQLAEVDYTDSKIDKNTITVSKGGVYALFDLGREEAGFLSLKITTEEKTTISVGYGEHIIDGRVRTYIDGRRFAADIGSEKGEWEYLNTFRRFGARYLQIFADCKKIKIEHCTLRPVQYPLKKIEFAAADIVSQKIYDTSVRTLQLCMNRHYEDTPWREQALYTLDSRNQMLCGYYAFKEYGFARASLQLIGLDKCEDGLLSICAPSKLELKIPSFSLYYIIQMREYIKYSGDKSLSKEYYEKLKKMLRTFTERIADGLVPNFSGDKKYWNFYEWNSELCGKLWEADSHDCDLILNCLLSIALKNLAQINRYLDFRDDANSYLVQAKDLNKAINKAFYDTQRQCYFTSLNKRNHFSRLGNALAILCGAARQRHYLAELLTAGESEFAAETLSMSCFVYDALIKTSKEKYRDYILGDIKTKYTKMLSEGATSFWETLLGANDFNNAGSLCHGWSGMPVYYYHILGSRGAKK